MSLIIYAHDAIAIYWYLLIFIIVYRDDMMLNDLIYQNIKYILQVLHLLVARIKLIRHTININK